MELVNLQSLNRVKHRDYVFLGLTQSLCPECCSVVPAKIIARGKRVYFRKECPTHGKREDFICSDVDRYDMLETSLPAKLPKQTFIEAERGCPYDCGLCEEHEQHTCVAVLEITEGCNLTCPMCYAASKPGKSHRSFEEVCSAIDRLVAAEGQPEVLQLSGGEPTLHPEFTRIVDYALSQPIDYIMINTNGIRLSHDEALLEHLAQHKDRIEIYFQFDSLDDGEVEKLRGQAGLVETKLKALERIAPSGLNVTLVSTLQGGVNDSAPAQLLRFAEQNPYVTGLSFQPATYSGRYALPEDLERRITFPDVVDAIVADSQNRFTASDFFPLPCAHPNCHWLSLSARTDDGFVPLTHFVDAQAHLDLLANGLSFTRHKTTGLAQQLISRIACGDSGCCGSCEDDSAAKVRAFIEGVAAQQIGARDMLRITITSFLDVFNFDLRRVMKCCTHHVLPSGHIIPFCAYNVLYREGRVSLPELHERSQ